MPREEDLLLNLQSDDELEQEEAEFLAKNQSRAEKAFVERTNYRKEAYPQFSGFPTPIDLWYNKGLYGKVDTHYNSVVTTDTWQLESLITKVLKKIPGEDQEIFAMNFVVDAFEAFREHMNTAAKLGQIHPQGSVVVPMKPKRGWSSIENQYKDYLDAVYKGFAATFLEQNQNYKKVTNFKSFMKTFSQFLERTMPNFPLSMSGYVLSNNYPLGATGLMIEIAEANHGNDEVKYKQFINDKNFVFYVAAAQKFGFRVDKNAPWRLIADINGRKMKEFMDRYPELPPQPIPSGSAPTPPCELLLPTDTGMFKDLIGQKIEFLESINPAQGIVTDITCNAANPQDAEFVMVSYCPGDDADLLDYIGEGTIIFTPATHTILAIRSPNETAAADVSNPRYTEDFAFGKNVVYDNTKPLVWLNTIHSGSIGSPIVLNAEASLIPTDGYFKWSIHKAPFGFESDAVFFIDVNGGFESPIRKDPLNYNSLVNKGVSVGAIMFERTGPHIGFLPTAPGEWEIKAELFDVNNHLLDTNIITVKFCEVPWDALERVPLPPLLLEDDPPGDCSNNFTEKGSSGKLIVTNPWLYHVPCNADAYCDRLVDEVENHSEQRTDAAGCSQFLKSIPFDPALGSSGINSFASPIASAVADFIGFAALGSQWYAARPHATSHFLLQSGQREIYEYAISFWELACDRNNSAWGRLGEHSFDLDASGTNNDSNNDNDKTGGIGGLGDLTDTTGLGSGTSSTELAEQVAAIERTDDAQQTDDLLTPLTQRLSFGGSRQPCIPGIIKRVKIYLPRPNEPAYYQEWNFRLINGDNIAFQNNRREFERVVNEYNLLRTAYQTRVDAWQAWFQQKSDHDAIHISKQYGGPLTFDNLFMRQFQKTINLDIPQLKEYILNVYNSYVLYHPILVTTKIRKGGEGTVRCLQERKMITKDEMMDYYSDAYWVDFYFALRIMESRKDISVSTKKNFRVRVKNILQLLPAGATDIERANSMERILDLINAETKGVLKEKLSLTRSDTYDII